jgi:hypothetical protein
MSEVKHTPNTWEGMISHINSEGGAAFPASLKSVDGTEASWSGMTLRDYFAAHAPWARANFLGDNPTDMAVEKVAALMATKAYAFADAMLAERSK